MKRFPIFIIALLAIVVVGSVISSCGSDNDNWDAYRRWRAVNEEWYQQQVDLKGPDGKLFYSPVQPNYYPKSGVLIHYYNDRNLTAGNLKPFVSSTVRVKYKGMLYDGTGFDSSYNNVDSVTDMPLSSVIQGWQLALTEMHVGDSVDIVIPYPQGYGSNGSASINPYSTLKFSIKLVDIPGWEIPAYGN